MSKVYERECGVFKTSTATTDSVLATRGFRERRMASQRPEKESVYVEDLKDEIGVQNERLGRDIDVTSTRGGHGPIMR